MQGMKHLGVDAARPVDDATADAAVSELTHQRARADERVDRGAVEPSLDPVADRERDWQPCSEILGKPRVKARRELKATPLRPQANRHAKRTFGRDVQCLR